jgi:phosphoribosyl-AMP cyclohydrolase
MGGLLAVVIQDVNTKQVLMLGYMNQIAWKKTLETGLVTFWSRTRNALWTKGETSGHHLVVKRIWADCDLDALLIEAEPHGPTCHTGAVSCFFEEITNA